MKLLTSLPVGPTDRDTASQVSRALRRALDGSGPAIAPVAVANPTSSAPPGAADAPSDPRAVPDDVALVVATSGSTGQARGVLLDREALLASAAATETRLGGPGRWVLALPVAHVAGLQVLVRSIVAGTDPVVVPAAGGFDPTALAAAVLEAGTASPLHTSLVPTQLHRIVAASPDGLPRDLAPLRRLDAILVGGAAAAPHLLDRARDLGLRVVTTYGMTETCGGCVYDGVPLDGVRVTVDDDPAGPVRLAGPVLARGYLDRPDLDAECFTTDAGGTRWFTTRDLGTLEGGRLAVLGRADDVVVTGGHKVAPAAVEAVLSRLPGVDQVCVVGVPDEEWGQALTAVVVPSDRQTARTVGAGVRAASPTLVAMRDAVSRTLGPAAVPRALLLVDALPERGPGKIDRSAVARRASTRTAPQT